MKVLAYEHQTKTTGKNTIVISTEQLTKQQFGVGGQYSMMD